MVRPRRRQTGEPSKESAPERVSSVAENYLLSLYILKEEGIRTAAAQLADYIRRAPVGEGLGTTLPSVLGMLRRMAKEHLLEMSPEKEVLLTPRGTVLAESIVRRHRLAERMVVDLLGLELHRAHIEAHRLEHAISPELEAKITERLGNPVTCPFGAPIPGSGYNPPVGQRLTMNRAEVGVTYLVDRIPEEDSELVRFLVEHGVVPEEEVRVLESGHYRGVLVFTTQRGESSLGFSAASHIWIRQP